MRMSIIADVNDNDDGMESNDNITLMFLDGGGFYIEQGRDGSKADPIAVTNKKQAKALVMGIKAMIAASGW